MTFGDLLVQKDGLIRGPFGGDIKKSLFVPKAADTYKVYEQGVVLNHDINRGDYYVSKEYFEKKLKRFEVKENDILLTGAGTLGELFVVPTNAPKGVINQALLRIRLNKDVVNQNFFCYYFKYYIKAIIGNINGDSVIPNLPPLPIIKSTVIDIPDITYQQKIAAVLSALDAKIELNQRINAELESMAKTLYDYWFVQFDFPNEKGKPYKSTGGKMVWNEELKREIPLGWEVDNVLRIGDLLGGGTPKTKEPSYWGGDIPFFTPKDTDDSIFVLKTLDYITEAGLESCSSRLYPKGTIFITARGTVGNINVAAQDMAMNQSCYAIQPKPEINYYFLHQCSENLVHYLKAKSNGSIFDAIVSNDIKLTPIVIPPLPLIQEFGKITKDMYEKILVNKKESQTLTELRDWLLPMLMNGQVEIKG